MEKYNLYVNNSPAGSLETDDIEAYMKESNYNKSKYKIDSTENEVFIYADILDVMKASYLQGNPHEEMITDVQGKELL